MKLNRIFFFAFLLFFTNSVCNRTVCARCSGNLCTSCPRNSYRILTSSKNCICANGYYDQGTTVCSRCSNSCLTCSSYNTCLSCNASANQYLVNNICKCMQGYFNNSNSICQACNYSCPTCSTENSCITCQNNSYRVLTYSNNCICADGYFDQGYTICAKCSYLCFTCERYNNCLSCDASTNRQLINNSCKCIQGYFNNNSSNLNCNACNSLCLTCSDAYTCISCNQILNLELYNNQCNCISGYYLNTQNICAPCQQKCGTCSNADTCDTCQIFLNRIYYNSDCICQTGYNEDEHGGCIINSKNNINVSLVIIIVISILGFILMNTLITVWYFKIYKRRQEEEIIEVFENQLETEARIQQLNQEMYNEKDICSICLQPETTIRTSCRHQYHPQCIVEWYLHKRKICPNCNQQNFMLFSLCNKCYRFMERISVCKATCKNANHIKCFQQKMEKSQPCKHCKNP